MPLQRYFGSRPPLSLGIFGVVLVEIGFIFPRASICPPRAVPEVECLTVHAVRRGHDLNKIPPRDFYCGDL